MKYEADNGAKSFVDPDGSQPWLKNSMFTDFQNMRNRRSLWTRRPEPLLECQAFSGLLYKEAENSSAWNNWNIWFYTTSEAHHAGPKAEKIENGQSGRKLKYIK